MPFFRLTPAIAITVFLITAAAAGLLYYTLLCALNGAGDCFRLPMIVQLLLIVILWPWVAAVRLLGPDMIAPASVLGFALSCVWIFVIVSCVRWIAPRLRRTSRDGKTAAATSEH